MAAQRGCEAGPVPHPNSVTTVGDRDWLIGLRIFWHGLRVCEACNLHWDDIDLSKSTITVRRLKGSHDSTHYLERDEIKGIKALRRSQATPGDTCSSTSAVSRSAAWASPARLSGLAKPLGCRSRCMSTCCGTRPAKRWQAVDWIRDGSNTTSAMPRITNTVKYTATSPEPFKDIIWGRK